MLGTDAKRKRAKKLADDFSSEMGDIVCVKKSTGMNAKRGVGCGQICSLLFLFLLGSLAGNMVMM